MGQFNIILIVAAGAVVSGVILFSWLQMRRLSARLKRLESAGSTFVARPPTSLTAPVGRVRLAVRPDKDITAPGDFVAYGLDSSGYVAVGSENGTRGHLVVLVLRLTNLSREEIRLWRPRIIFRLGDGASKLEPPATLASLGRLSFFDAQGAPRLLEDVKDGFLERAVAAQSFHRNVLPLKPFEPVVSYTAFLPRRLTSLPVFQDDLLDLSFGCHSQEGWREFDGFWARPFRNLAVTYLT